MTNGFFMYLNGNALMPEQFCQNCLHPLCGEDSTAVMLNLTYQIFSAGNNKTAKNNLLKYDFDGNAYISYRDFGIYLKVYCWYVDGVCHANIVECEKDTSQPR